MSMNQKLLFIFNPHSGKGQIKNNLVDIVDIMVKAGYDVTIYTTQARADATRKVMEEAANFERIVCSGGDGTDGGIHDRVEVGVGSSAACGTFIVDDTGAPDFVLIDEEVVEKSTGVEAAAGYGRAFSCLVGLFDADFKKLMFARDFDESAVNTVAESIKIFESKKNDDNFKTRLARLMFTISKAKNNLDMKAESADAVARVMTEKFGRTFRKNHSRRRNRRNRGL